MQQKGGDSTVQAWWQGELGGAVGLFVLGLGTEFVNSCTINSPSTQPALQQLRPVLYLA